MTLTHLKKKNKYYRGEEGGLMQQVSKKGVIPYMARGKTDKSVEISAGDRVTNQKLSGEHLVLQALHVCYELLPSA